MALTEYIKNSWAAGYPILPDKVNHMEDGIEAAFNNAKSAQSQANTNAGTIDHMSDDIQAINDKIGEGFNASNTIASQFDAIDRRITDEITNISQINEDGSLAFNQLIGAGVQYDNSTGTFSRTLQQIFELYPLTSNVITPAIMTPSSADTVVIDNTSQPVNTLARRIKHIYDQITDVNTAIDHVQGEEDQTPNGLKQRLEVAEYDISILEDLVRGTSNQSVVARLDHLDGGNINTDADFPTRNIKSLITELDNAHSSTAFASDGLNATYESLDLRLEAGESRIVGLETEVNNAHYTGAATLDARFDAIDGGGQPSRTLPSIISEVETARNGANSLNTRLNALDDTQINDSLISRVSALESGKIDKTSIENGLTVQDEVTGKVLDARQGRALKGLIDGVDNKITEALTSTVIQTNNENTTYASLDARLEAIESHAADIRSDVDTIAGELDMVDANGLKTIGTRVDALDAHITAVADELGMVQSGEIVNTNTRIDTIDADLNTATTGIKDRLTAVESKADAAAVASTVNTALNGLDARLDAIDGGEALTGVSTLAARVGAAETAITNLQNEPKSATEIVANLPVTGDADKDYLLGPDEDGHYFYYKWINNEWNLISGGESGGGTSSAEFYASLLNVSEPSETVDYFIGSNGNYVHYRHLNGQWVTILPAGLINNIGVTLNGGLNASELGSNTNKLASFIALKNVAMTENTEDDEVVSYTLTFTDTNGDEYPFTLAAGGGGNASVVTASLNRIGDGNLTTIIGEQCLINFSYTATDSSGDTVATTSTATWSINRAQVATSTVVVGNNSFDITPYLHTGENNINLVVTSNIDNQIITRNKTWVVDVKNFSLTWEYDESTINEGSTINFSYVPYGIDIDKTVHLRIGSQEQTQIITTSGIPTTISVENNFSHGVYTAEMWMTATINDTPKTTVHVFHDFIVAESGNTTPIIAATLPYTTMDQYNTISIPFVVYTPNSNTSVVTLAVDGVTQDTREVGRTTQTWHYTPSTVSDDPQVNSAVKVLTITTGSVTKTLNLTVNKININNAEIGGYTFKLKANEIASNNALQAWYWDEQNPTTSKLSFSNNFNWVNGGIQTEYDENEQIRQYIRIKSGTTMTVPYKMFASDPRTNGMNFKIIFKIDNCRDYDATAATNIADNVGIQLNAHKAIFKSTDTEISTQYGEEEYTELEFEVYKRTLSNGADAPNRYMIEWIDGVMTTAREYGDGSFIQTNENATNLVIGSNDCDICIYLIKYYPFALSRDDHITNFIADAPNAVEMIKRYNRNDILDADEDIDYNKLAQKNRDCRVWLYDIERMTTGKKDPVNVNRFQQIWENGDQYYQLTGTNAKLTIQGTSSVNYRFGAANTDIDFRKKKAPDATLVDGYGNDLLSDELEYKGFKINDDSLPIEYSNMKVNFASCEQVNNMCNAEWYQRYQPFPSLSARDCMEFAMGVQFIKDHRQSEPADGSIVLFEERGAEFNPDKYYMYSIGNLGTSKKNTHLFHSENECCIEIKENTSDAQKMKSYDSTWASGNTDNYEMRYPDDPDADIEAGWERFVTWMVANNPNAATGNQLSEPVTFSEYTFKGHNREVTATEGRHFAQVLRGKKVYQYKGTYTHDTFDYRMAKMLSECEDYMAMDSVIYHFCFIERHTMVDNVAKNTFWSSIKEVGGPNDEEGYWIWDLSKNYDNDTADGNNNNGELRLDYGNEADDMYDGRPVFNGYDTVWFIFASHLYEACREMFIDREAVGAWDSKAYHDYLTTEQQKIPERVWNECYWYDYLRPFENNIEKAWIAKLDGGQKIHQRKHYETYEEIYDSSKYRGGVSHNQSITLRGEAIDYQTLNLPPQESRFEITMFNKCYLTIWIGTNYQTVKCAKGVPVTLSFYEDNDPSKGYMSLANSVIDIDSGSMVQTIGDLSRIYPSSGQFGKAKRLRSLYIGSDTAGYYNPVFGTTEALGLNNKMLEYLYVQNLPQATYSLNLTDCPELKYIDARGSGFTGFVFANGGLLNEAYVNTPASLVMRNLNALTNANFHLTSPTSVTSLRLEGCSLFNNYTFINQLTNLNVLRLTGINWILDNSSLLDRLLNIMGMDESGNAIPTSYLAGNVELEGTVYEGVYNSYTEAWSPDLTIDLSHATFIQQHLVIYKNESGTTVYSRYINHGGNVIDPYAQNLINDSDVAKDPDVQYQYNFGTTDNTDVYIPFSGWRLSSDSQSIHDAYNDVYPVNGNLTLYAVYSTSPQRYIVRWLLREGTTPVYETPSGQNYGGGYDLIAPTIKDIHDSNRSTYEFNDLGNGNCSYRIMTGWNKLPTNITPTAVGTTYDIYATWLERNNVSYSTVLSNSAYSNVEKLLVLKEIAAARTNLSIADTYPITLGYDGIKPAIDLVSQPTRYTGTATTINTYTPFAANKSFTMAIDYRFEHRTSNVADEAILLSCYEDVNNSVQGFKLFYNPRSASPVPQISFGSTEVQGSNQVKTIGSTIANRGMLVLRHRANDPLLYVYCGTTSSGLVTTYPTSFRSTIEWSGIASNAKIVLGGSNINNSSAMNAAGTLYSVKYWEEDLGEGECLQLANWCHETINFAVADFEGNTDGHSARNATLTDNLILHTLNASEMGTITEPSFTRSEAPAQIGWDPSTVRTFYNSRIYQAFPVLLQSILNPSTVPFRKANYTNEGYIIASTGTSTALDYVFAPSCVEFGENVGNHSVEADGPFLWANAQITIMQYSNGGFSRVSSNSQYTNLRFPYKPIALNNNTTIYIGYPTTNSSFYTWAQEHSITLRTGDILIPESSNVAYIYVAAADILKGAPLTNNTAAYLTTGSGGWIESTGWWTRSVLDSNGSGTINKFMYITSDGRLQTSSNTVKTHGIVYSIGL